MNEKRSAQLLSHTKQSTKTGCDVIIILLLSSLVGFILETGWVS